MERLDYREACTYLGITPEQEKYAAEYTDDLIPFPDGTYSVVVKPSPIHGYGLFATAPIKAGEEIAKCMIDGMRTPAGKYTNHSAVPNAERVMLDNGDIILVATEDIGGNTGGVLGDEVVINYIDSVLNMRIQ